MPVQKALTENPECVLLLFLCVSPFPLVLGPNPQILHKIRTIVSLPLPRCILQQQIFPSPSPSPSPSYQVELFHCISSRCVVELHLTPTDIPSSFSFSSSQTVPLYLSEVSCRVASYTNRYSVLALVLINQIVPLYLSEVSCRPSLTCAQVISLTDLVPYRFEAPGWLILHASRTPHRTGFCF